MIISKRQVTIVMVIVAAWYRVMRNKIQAIHQEADNRSFDEIEASLWAGYMVKINAILGNYDNGDVDKLLNDYDNYKKIARMTRKERQE